MAPCHKSFPIFPPFLPFLLPTSFKARITGREKVFLEGVEGDNNMLLLLLHTAR